MNMQRRGLCFINITARGEGPRRARAGLKHEEI